VSSDKSSFGTSSGTFLVGGAVRDALLGREVTDRDWVVVGRTPEEMLAEGYTQVGKDFPVFLHPQSHEEYALARTERKTAAGHLGFECHAGVDVTLEEDLARRDLTVNALAKGTDGALIDPYGGEQDLRDGVLRHVSPAFIEDPLRILRVARFAAQLGFAVAPETLALMQTMARDNAMAELPAERVWQEFHKALGSADVTAFVRVLRDAEALAPWFVELDLAESKLEVFGDTAMQRFGSVGSILGSKGLLNLAARVKAPRRFERFGVAAAEHSRLFCAWHVAPARALLDALQSCGALQNGAQERHEDFLSLLGWQTQAFGEFNAGALARLALNLSAIGAEEALAGARVAGEIEPSGKALGEAIARLRCEHIERAQRAA